jgi:putative ABC transport system permease protein
MNALRFAPLLLSSLRRRPVRTLLTLASVGSAFLLFGMMASLHHALNAGVELTGADRLVVFHKMSFIQPLPRSYYTAISAMPGVRAATSTSWFGGFLREERNVIVAQAVDPDTAFDVFPEFVVDPAQRQAWLQDRTGALVGESLARANGWKIGDIVPLRSNIFRKADGSDTWDLRVDAIFRTSDESGDTNSLLLHYDYFNEPRAYGRDTIGGVAVRVRDRTQVDAVARSIDARYANSATETKTSTERAFAQGFLNQIGNIGRIITLVVSAVFFTMLLVTANTMAQSVRERTGELGVLKTLGFSGGQVLGLVLAESLLLTLVGALAGMLLAHWLANGARHALQQYLPAFGLSAGGWLLAAAFALLLGIGAGAAPAVQAWRLRISDALRQA